jgi:hypothetical protein
MTRLTLFSILCCSLLVLTSCDEINTEPPDIQVLRESRPVENTKEFSVDVKYDIGQLEIMKATDDNLFSFDLQYDKRRSDPKFTFDAGDRASMRLDTNHLKGGLSGGRGKDNDLTLRLSDKVPLDLTIATGVAESHLEMTGLQVHRMHLRGGVGKTEVTFDKAQAQPMDSFDVESGVGELIIHGLGNTQVSHVDLKGGVGNTELDFTGDLGVTHTEASVQVGVGEIRLTIPRDADVEIEAEGSFLSNISAPSFEHSGKTYTHHGDGGARIRIHVQSGVGAVEVELI